MIDPVLAYDRSMKKLRSPMEQVFIAPGSAGELVIMSAARHREQMKKLRRVGLKPQDLKRVLVRSAEIDSSGRVKRPDDIRRYLLSSMETDSPDQ